MVILFKGKLRTNQWIFMFSLDEWLFVSSVDGLTYVDMVDTIRGTMDGCSVSKVAT
jgi:hypothetical protein